MSVDEDLEHDRKQLQWMIWLSYLMIAIANITLIVSVWLRSR